MSGTLPALALDLATTTGWALGLLGKKPRSGSIKLGGAGTSRPARYAALNDWLDSMNAAHGPFSEVVFESPLVEGQGRDRALLALGLVAHLELWCWDRDLRTSECMVASTRKAVLGRGTFPKGEAKGVVMAWCKSRGFDPQDDNAGDAIVLWSHLEMIRTARLRRPA